MVPVGTEQTTDDVYGGFTSFPMWNPPMTSTVDSNRKISEIYENCRRFPVSGRELWNCKLSQIISSYISVRDKAQK